MTLAFSVAYQDHLAQLKITATSLVEAAAVATSSAVSGKGISGQPTIVQTLGYLVAGSGNG
jgi:hypothetical protein